MAEFASDTFTGTNGTILSTYSADWVQHPLAGTTAQIASGRVRATAAATALYYHVGAPASPDYRVSADVYEHTEPLSYYTGVIGRSDTSELTFYMARHANDGIDAWQLYKCISGTFTQLGSNSTDGITTGTSARVELFMDGTSIVLYKRGGVTPTIAVTDSSITDAGKSGFRTGATTITDTTGYHLDNFSAVDSGGDVTNRFLLLMGVGT